MLYLHSKQKKSHWCFEKIQNLKLEEGHALPIIDQKVVFVTIQSLPHVILKGSLLVHGNTRGRSSLQLPVHGSGPGLSLIYYHERHICQVAARQLATQASNPTEGQKEREPLFTESNIDKTLQSMTPTVLFHSRYLNLSH